MLQPELALLHHSAPTERATYRRPYKKSTSGCDACKSRKVKCDETRPICGNCKKHYANVSACQYGLPKGRSKANIQKPLSGPELLALPVRPVTLNATNTLALRLMHHYTVSMSLDRPSSSCRDLGLVHTLWEVEIPRIAFTSRTVMNGLLGISAWNLWAKNPLDRSLLLASRAYLGMAIELQIAALEQQDSQALGPAFIASIILAHHSWLLSYCDGDKDLQLTFQTFHLCKGIRSLSSKTSPSLSKYMGPCLEIPTNMHYRLSPLNAFMERVIRDSNGLLEHVEHADVSQEDREVYIEVIQKITGLYALLVTTTEEISAKENTAVSFLHQVPSSFIRLLERQEPLAMGLVARVCVSLSLLKKQSRAWWIHGTGQFLAYRLALSGIQKQVPIGWKWVLDWPLEIISGTN